MRADDVTLEYSQVMKRFKEGKCPVCESRDTTTASHEWFRCKLWFSLVCSSGNY